MVAVRAPPEGEILATRRAVRADVLVLGGGAQELSQQQQERLKAVIAALEGPLIVLSDPDPAGRQLRRNIEMVSAGVDTGRGRGDTECMPSWVVGGHCLRHPAATPLITPLLCLSQPHRCAPHNPLLARPAEVPRALPPRLRPGETGGADQGRRAGKEEGRPRGAARAASSAEGGAVPGQNGRLRAQRLLQSGPRGVGPRGLRLGRAKAAGDVEDARGSDMGTRETSEEEEVTWGHGRRESNR